MLVLSYAVTATAVGGHGSVSCTPSIVAAGSGSVCTAVPDAGYQVASWTGACAATGTGAHCNLANVQSDLASTVSFAPVTYSVAATVVGGHGFAICAPATVNAGGTSVCTAYPNPGFQVQGWSGACAAAGSNAQCTLTNVQANQNSTVSFVLTPPATYSVTATVTDGAYGSVGCYPDNVKAGDGSVCIAVPLAGFRVKAWGGACAAAGSNAQCSLANIGANQVSTVSFELTPPATYTVTATVVGGSYGVVSCLPTSVLAGQSSICSAVPQSGFRVLSWGGDCAAAGSNATCTLSKIQADQSATVSFELTPPATYNVSASVAGGNGSASCLPTSVLAGGTSVCYAVPLVGFQVQGWTGACAGAGTAGQCSLANIQADQSSTVSFAATPLPTYTVSATVASGSGTVSCAPGTVTKGDSSSCTAVPAAGWQVQGWTGACAATGGNAQCHLKQVAADQASQVSFAPIPPATFSVSATVVLGHGAVGCTPGTVAAGGNSLCTVVPDSGYQVQGWGGACASAGANAQCSLTHVQADQLATVSLAPIPPVLYTVSATVNGGHGAVSCTPPTTAAGGSSSCLAAPYAGYQVQGWTGACAAAGVNAQCDLANVQADRSSQVSFVAIPLPTYTVTATAPGGNGTVSCGPSPVVQGGSSSCIAAPDVGYQVQGWTGACAATGTNVQCTLPNVQANQSSVVSFVAIAPTAYAVSASVLAGLGTVSCAPTTVSKGGQSTCTAVPAAGWQVQGWGGACSGAGTNTQCYLAKISKDKAATVSFAQILPQTYTVTAIVVGGNGSVACTPSPVARKGQSTCTALPDPGFQVASWGGACQTVLPSTQCFFSKIEKNLASTVTFAAIPPSSYTVTAVVIGGNGSVSCTPGTVAAGGGSACTAVPDAGYRVQAWGGACVLAGNAAQCSLAGIQADQYAEVSFEAIPPITFPVTATVAGGNGTVSCAPATVVKGGNSSCTAVPNAGYHVQGWTGDCAATGANVQCWLPKIQKAMASTVSFAAIPPSRFSVAAAVVLGDGSVSCTPATVAAGGSATCTAAPAGGFGVQAWGGACAAAGSSTRCDLTGIGANQSATVSFVAQLPVGYAVTASVVGGHGTVSCSPSSVAAGGSSVCTATPDPGYQVQGWSGACAAAGTGTQCTLNNVQADLASTVTFSPGTTPQATPIPVMPWWGLALMGLLLLGSARRHVARVGDRRGGNAGATLPRD
ncbi:MAG: hypothetical protein IPM22_08435 [Betaproteobacteria bacterium]|nr:hypothetical protein [Betaproteobacteria bacterium]